MTLDSLNFILADKPTDSKERKECKNVKRRREIKERLLLFACFTANNLVCLTYNIYATSKISSLLFSLKISMPRMLQQGNNLAVTCLVGKFLYNKFQGTYPEKCEVGWLCIATPSEKKNMP